MLLLLGILLTAFGFISSASIDETISKAILQGYDKTVTPRGLVNIDVTLYFRQLVTMDEKNQIMTTNSYIAQEWIDPRLEWPPENFDNIDKIIMQAKKLWLPELCVLNSADGDGFLKISDQNLAIVQSTGKVYLLVSLNALKTRCKMNILKFPYDNQTCPIRLASWALSTSDILIDKVSLLSSDVLTNPVWNITNITSEIKPSSERFASSIASYESDDITFTFYLQRRPLYYMMAGVFPTFILNILLLLVYFLPDKAQIGLTLAIILTTSVYLLRVSSDIPVQSDYLPYVTLYFVFCHIYNIVSLAWFTLSSYLLSKKYLPKFVQKICLKIRKLTCDRKVEDKKPKGGTQIEKINESDLGENKAQNKYEVAEDKKEEKTINLNSGEKNYEIKRRNEVKKDEEDKAVEIKKEAFKEESKKELAKTDEAIKDQALVCNCQPKSEKDLQKEKEFKQLQKCMNVIHYGVHIFMFIFMFLTNLTIWLIIST